MCVKENYHMHLALIEPVKVLCYSLRVCCLQRIYSSQSHLWVVWRVWSIPKWWKLLLLWINHIRFNEERQVILTAMVAMVFLLSLNWHIVCCNQPDSVENIPGRSAWKPVHSYDFHSPTRIMLSVLAGSGMQLCMMTFVSLLFACLGLLSPNCEAILTIVLVPYAFLGVVSEYVSVCLCKRTGVLQWKNNMLMMALFYPEIVFGIFFDFELVLWAYHSAVAILFTTLLAMLLSLQHFNMDLTFGVIPVRIFRNYIPLVFINQIKNSQATFQRMINTVISGY